MAPLRPPPRLPVRGRRRNGMDKTYRKRAPLLQRLGRTEQIPHSRHTSPGFFYFISGQPGHCKLGQRLIVRVMHPLQPDLPPASAPSGGDSGWPEFSSTAKLSVVSYFVAAFVALAVTFWLFL
ncbi:hypothetical protein SASPL_114282 [Salvia splendens]|uniref:Phytocyanin domain-containing protein n=1 Tax=Salvia splendens TaxID=180675 RepID=A0A8X8Y4E3_SALSN|nr:hypothetical protein SASPL_114282 [Salvia splendens]